MRTIVKTSLKVLDRLRWWIELLIAWWAGVMIMLLLGVPEDAAWKIGWFVAIGLAVIGVVGWLESDDEDRKAP